MRDSGDSRCECGIWERGLIRHYKVMKMDEERRRVIGVVNSREREVVRNGEERVRKMESEVKSENGAWWMGWYVL